MVVFVGENTEIGKIAARLASGGTNQKTELTRTMEILMYFLFFVGLVFGGDKHMIAFFGDYP